MRKIFHNVGYEHEGWYVCEYRDYPYKNRTDKPWFVNVNNVTTVSQDPEVQALLKERQEALQALHEELLGIAKKLQVKFHDFFEAVEIPAADAKDVIVDEEDGKRLSEALLAQGWSHEFIAIGP